MQWDQCGFQFRWNGGRVLEVVRKTTQEPVRSFPIGPRWRPARIGDVEEAVDTFCQEYRRKLPAELREECECA
jgi:hypothetical protein